MLVVNQGVSGQYHIFRGSAGREFIGGCDVVRSQKVIVLLPKERREAALFFLTRGGTFLLVMKPEDLSDAMATLIFRQVAKQWAAQLRRRDATA